MSNPKFNRYISTAVSMGYISKAGADIILSMPTFQDAPSIECAIDFDATRDAVDAGALVVNARALHDSVPREMVERAYKAMDGMVKDTMLEDFDTMMKSTGIKANSGEAVGFTLFLIDTIFTGLGHWNLYCKDKHTGFMLITCDVTPDYEESGNGEDPFPTPLLP